MKWEWESPENFKPGDKVRFHGLKARVVSDEPWGVRDTFPIWAVPITIKGSVYVTIAHVDDLQRRGHKK